MAAPDLASRKSDAQHEYQAQDSFASPQSIFLTAPHQLPCAPLTQPDRSAAPHLHHSVANARDTGHEMRQQRFEQSGAAYKSTSVSSAGSSVMSLTDHEKSGIIVQKPPRAYQRDPEKAMPHIKHDSHQSRHTIDNASMSYSMVEEAEDDNGRFQQHQNTIRILLFLLGPVVMLSALNTAWACTAVIITLLSQPVRLCARRLTFGQQLSGLLGPALNLQLRCIYTPLQPHANEDASYHAWALVMAHLISPFVSLGIMFLAWVLAVYWISSMIVGDPAGMDKRDDGRETVLGLRQWWEAYLMRCVKEV